MKKSIKIQRRIHTGWKEWNEKMPKLMRKQSIFGEEGWVKKYQYIYSSPNGSISLVKLNIGNFENNKPLWLWEIYCLEGDLFKDVERFRTKKQAEEKINKLL